MVLATLGVGLIDSDHGCSRKVPPQQVHYFLGHLEGSNHNFLDFLFKSFIFVRLFHNSSFSIGVGSVIDMGRIGAMV